MISHFIQVTERAGSRLIPRTVNIAQIIYYCDHFIKLVGVTHEMSVTETMTELSSLIHLSYDR
jgi:hypothetical protein